jgi:methyl-accepting chemotaxis protein
MTNKHKTETGKDQRFVRGLKFRHKMILLPAVAALGAIAVIGISLWMDQRINAETVAIQSGYAPALASSRTQQVELAFLQQALQNAVAAADPLILNRADSIAGALQGSFFDHSVIPGVDRDETLATAEQFSRYYEVARATSARIIANESLDSLRPSLERMREEFVSLTDVLNSRLESDRQGMEDGFRNLEALRSSTTNTTVLLLFLVVAGLVLISIWIIRNVLGAMTRLTEIARAIAVGRLNEAHLDYRVDDEIGQLTDAFRAMSEYVGGVAGAMQRLADGDLSVELELRSQDDLLSRNVQAAADTLRALVSETSMLVEATREGNRDRRGDAAAFRGV